MGGGVFAPESTVTRAQFAKMVTNSRGLTYSGGLPDFTDVPPTHWAYNYVMAAKQAGIISGYGDGRFGPEDLVTRAQIGKMVTNTRGLTYTGGLPEFSDVPPTHWAYNYVMAARQYGIISGYGDGRFGPEDQATRAQSSKMVANMMLIPDTTPPVITISSPISTTYATHIIPLNVAADETISTWLYSLNGAANVSFTPDTTITASEGTNTITVYASDMAGNWNSKAVSFIVDTMSD
jgi:hypothetical protein